MADHEYTGHVEPGGEAAVRTLQGLQIRKLSVGPMDNNAYLLTCRSTGAQLLVDAAADPDALLQLIAAGATAAPGATGATGTAGAAGARLDLIVTTHSHHDHVGALAEIVGATGARTAAGAEDAAALPVPVDLPLGDGDVLEVGTQTVEIIHLRGHTPGSVALLWRGGTDGDHLFTGDSLFPGGVGNTDRDPRRFAQLIDDVQRRIFDRLADGTWVYPGHGDDTTLGAERASLPAWRARGW